MNDWDDLQAFVREGNEEAFARVVRQHIGLVHSAVQRQLRNRAASDEVTQMVFVVLVEKAATLKPTGSLGAWLYRVACLQAKDYRRRERARQKREGVAMRQEDASEEVLWEAIAPVLDKAMGTLNAADREALVLRFFERRSLREVGEVLGLSEEATRKRVTRALERLRAWFARHEIHCSASVLGGALGASAVLAVPQALVDGVIRHAVTQTPAVPFGILAGKLPLLGAFFVSAALPITLANMQTATPAIVRESEAGPFLVKRDGLFAIWDGLKAAHESLPELHEAVARLEDAYQRRALGAVLIAEWLQRDLEGALHHYARSGDWLQFIHVWEASMRADAERTVATLLAGPKAFERFYGTVLVDVGREKPDELSQLAPHLLPKNPSDESLADAYTAAAEADLNAARVSLNGLSGEALCEATAGFAKGWAKSDGPAAWAWAQSLEPNALRGRVLGNLLEGWAISDPIAALEHVKDVPAGGGYEGWSNRGPAFEVMAIAARQDLERVLDWLVAHPSAPGASGVGGAVMERFYEAPEATLTWLQDYPLKLKIAGIIQVSLINLERPLNERVIEWLSVQTVSEFTANISKACYGRVVCYDPDRAVDLVNGLIAQDRASEDVLGQVAASLVGMSFPSLDRHLARAAPALREMILRKAIPRLPGRRLDAEAWDSYLLELPEDLQREAVKSLGAVRAESDPQAALEWVATLDASQQAAAVERIAATWAGADSHACSVWLAEEEAGPQRDWAVVGMVTAIASSDVRSAATWAQTIQDPVASEQAHRAIQNQLEGEVTHD